MLGGTSKSGGGEGSFHSFAWFFLFSFRLWLAPWGQVPAAGGLRHRGVAPFSGREANPLLLHLLKCLSGFLSVIPSDIQHRGCAFIFPAMKNSRIRQLPYLLARCHCSCLGASHQSTTCLSACGGLGSKKLRLEIQAGSPGAVGWVSLCCL